MSDYKLGKKIVAPPKPKEDVIEDMGNGLYKRNGKFETWLPVPPPAPAPVEVDIQIFTTKRRDEMTGILQRQEEDGFPVFEFGVM